MSLSHYVIPVARKYSETGAERAFRTIKGYGLLRRKTYCRNPQTEGVLEPLVHRVPTEGFIQKFEIIPLIQSHVTLLLGRVASAAGRKAAKTGSSSRVRFKEGKLPNEIL